ncbi:cysteine desulfurase family protein [Bacillus gobiensis]|uniref:cysteine desulfurase family protein n=1 Tax=Bacillus gobiensis TaxID=1441095 RepID=UPI003D1CD072
MNRIYLDHAATSPTDPKVVEKMMPYFTETFGNPSSIHSFGRESRKWVDEARGSIANLIGASQNEIIFTSGGTEANNLAIIGAALSRKHKGNHIITTEIEHHAVLHPCERLEEMGFQVTYLKPDQDGKVSAGQVRNALREDTILVTIMYGNNEVGSVQPIKDIGELVKNHTAYFHTDAVQAFGYLPIQVKSENIDLMSVSGHKLNGPKGTGFLYVSQDAKLSPQMLGGEQERKQRAGTENVPGIVGLNEAVRLSVEKREAKSQLYREFKTIMIQSLKEKEVNVQINGDVNESLPHVLNLYFPGVQVEALLVNLDLEGIAVSSGSACTAGSLLPSHVLKAMYGEDAPQLRSSVRISFGPEHTKEKIKRASEKLAEVVRRLM